MEQMIKFEDKKFVWDFDKDTYKKFIADSILAIETDLLKRLKKGQSVRVTIEEVEE
jgi:hypothetical protein